MKIKITAPYVILHNVRHEKDAVLEYGINAYHKSALVLNGQAVYTEEESKEDSK